MERIGSFLFDLSELPINSFNNKIDISSLAQIGWQKKLLMELKNKFPEVFSGRLGRCIKTKVKFEVKENVKTIFKPKRNVTFSFWNQ